MSQRSLTFLSIDQNADRTALRSDMGNIAVRSNPNDRVKQTGILEQTECFAVSPALKVATEPRISMIALSIVVDLDGRLTAALDRLIADTDPRCPREVARLFCLKTRRLGISPKSRRAQSRRSKKRRFLSYAEQIQFLQVRTLESIRGVQLP